ncbi:MAG TPA: glycosyltransferase family 2 protein [Pseudonocardia sp.]|jgi:glycosyltransferase involved in cell wall biosynthesis|nr:glycosyltransferase family 2 protein [Pseudonocardia sp.]
MEAELSEERGLEAPRTSPINHVSNGRRANGGLPAPAQNIERLLPSVEHNGHVVGAIAYVDPVPTVSLIIPTKNEAPNISWVLEQVPSCVDEIVLVDGRSTDATVVTARACRPDLRIVAQQKQGKGDALRAGFLSATGDIIVMIDADGSMSPKEISHFLHFLTNGFDFVKGSRFMGGGRSLDITRVRRLGNRFLLLLVNRLYGANLTDLCYGFCAFHRRYLPYLDLTTTGFEVETQLTISALKSGLRIAEVPSVEMPRRCGESNLRTVRDGIRVLRTVLRGHRRGLSGRAVQTIRHRVHKGTPDEMSASVERDDTGPAISTPT